jgi:hypothetical protein
MRLFRFVATRHGQAWLDMAVQVRTGKLLRVRVRPGWVGRGKAVWVRKGCYWFGMVGLGKAV